MKRDDHGAFLGEASPYLDNAALRIALRPEPEPFVDEKTFSRLETPWLSSEILSSHDEQPGMAAFDPEESLARYAEEELDEFDVSGVEAEKDAEEANWNEMIQDKDELDALAVAEDHYEQSDSRPDLEDYAADDGGTWNGEISVEDHEDEFLPAPTFEREDTQAKEACRKKWLAEVSSYPEPLQEAIARAQSKGLTRGFFLQAVQHGIRHRSKLTRLLYFSVYGPVDGFGFCAPKNQMQKGAWKTTAAEVQRYLKQPLPPIVQIGPADCSGQKSRAIEKDTPAFDVTGRYYTRDSHATFVINQAGSHVEGFRTQVIDSSDRRSGGHRPLIAFHGDLHDRTVDLFNRTTSKTFAPIRERDGNFFIAGEWLRPIEKRPTLMGPAALNGTDRTLKLIEQHELAPLTLDQTAYIRNLLDKNKLEEGFKAFFDKGGDRLQRHSLGALSRRLVDTRDDNQRGRSPYTGLSRFHEVDLPLVRMYAKHILTLNKWTSGRNVTRSHVDWIQIMMDVTLGANSADGKDFSRYLGQSPDPKRGGDPEAMHTYEFELRITGGSFLLAGYTGTVLIRRTSGKKWAASFDVDFLGVTVALQLLDVKFRNEFKGAARSYVDWSANDILGPVRLARASASIGMDVASAQAGFMHVLGNGSLPPLEVFFWDATLGFPNISKIVEDTAKDVISGDAIDLKAGKVAGPDASVSVLSGSISPSGSLIEKARIAAKGLANVDLSRDAKTDVAVERHLAAEAHFCLKGDQLTDAGRQALRIMCARELPSFTTPDTYLLLVGHADTLGNDKNNTDLSERRAKNTVLAMRDILGRQFKIRNDKDHIKILPMGELWAGIKSQGKTTAAPEHRRVQILLNSKVVLTLFGQGSSA